MCIDCGCQEGNKRAYFNHHHKAKHGHKHEHKHGHSHKHDHGHKHEHQAHTHSQTPSVTEIHYHYHQPIENMTIHNHYYNHGGPVTETTHDDHHGHHEHTHEHHEHTHGHPHHGSHDHEHSHSHQSSEEDDNESESSRKIVLGNKVLAANDAVALQNRRWIEEHNIVAVNLISSPGTGKTYLLEKTIDALKEELLISVLVGDQQTNCDADRMEDKGAKIKQINTYSSCHLDALMIQKELAEIADRDTDLLIIENVGNLVCPAAFDLGEESKIALLSTAEGEEKPLKYPVLFHGADVVVITKMDLIPVLEWDFETCRHNILKVNPNARIIALSAKTGEGMGEWLDFLRQLKSSAQT